MPHMNCQQQREILSEVDQICLFLLNVVVAYIYIYIYIYISVLAFAKYTMMTIIVGCLFKTV